MSPKFDIQVNLNGWMIPFKIERKGYGIFKVAYENVSLGYLLLNESAKWLYLKSVKGEELLNPYSTRKITEAIVNY